MVKPIKIIGKMMEAKINYVLYPISQTKIWWIQDFLIGTDNFWNNLRLKVSNVMAEQFIKRMKEQVIGLRHQCFLD